MKGADSIFVNSSKDKVWEIILAGSEYFKWNSFIIAIEGELKEGNKVKLKCLSNAKGKITYDAMVERLEDEKELRLKVTNPFNKFIYYIEINETEDGEVEVVQGKEFYGLCALIKKTYVNKEIKKLKIMNKELKGYILMAN